MDRVILAVNNESTTLSASDILLRNQLAALGYQVRHAPWLDIDAMAVRENETVVLRTVWDYSVRLVQFRAWIAGLRSAGVHLINDARLVAWNVDKSYLLDLRSAGIETPRTCAPDTLEQAMTFITGCESAEFVVKPRVGGGGIDVFRLSKQDTLSAMAERTLPFTDIIVQEYCPEVQDGEISLIFFHGVYSHAIRRTPSWGDFRANASYGSTVETYDPSPHFIAEASKVLCCAPVIPVFARVDAFIRGTALICSEFELVDPALFLKYSSNGAANFAKAVHMARRTAADG